MGKCFGHVHMPWISPARTLFFNELEVLSGVSSHTMPGAGRPNGREGLGEESRLTGSVRLL